MEGILKVFYHNDNDGKCSAAIVAKFDPIGEAEFIKCQYGDEFPLDTIAVNERVYILDYSIEPEEMTELLGITEDVIWIDHHKTAIEKYSEFAWRNRKEEWCNWEDIAGTRQDGVAGCYITWRYFNAWSELPLIVKLIADRDVWKFEFGEETRNLYYGLKGMDKGPENKDFWGKALRSDGTSATKIIINNGPLIRAAFECDSQEFVEENGFYFQFRGYKCFACNFRKGSEPYQAVAEDADIWIAFYYMGDQKCWTVSLYSENPDLDVSEIAKQYKHNGKRGGGHKGAAGFQCDYPPFLSIEGV